MSAGRKRKSAEGMIKIKYDQRNVKFKVIEGEKGKSKDEGAEVIQFQPAKVPKVEPAKISRAA